MSALADAPGFARFLLHWHGLHEPAVNGASLSRVIQKLQGYPMPYSDIEDHILPARLRDYQYGDLDHPCEQGIIAWQGVQRTAGGDGRIALYLKEMIPELARISAPSSGEICARLRRILADGPRRFDELRTCAGGFPPQLLEAVWDMVWAGELSNRRLLPLQTRRAREVRHRPARGYRRARLGAGARRFEAPPGSGGEWYLLAGPASGFADPAARDAALVTQILVRWGVASAEVFEAENTREGWARYCAIMREWAARGRLVERDVVSGFRSPQFTLPSTARALAREAGRASGGDEFVVLAASDPANPYGAVFPWPATAGSPGARPKRAAGARVIIYNGYPIGYLSRGGHELCTYLRHDGLTGPPGERLVHALCSLAGSGRPVLLKTVDGRHPSQCELEPRLRAYGFAASQNGYIYRG